MTLLPASEVQVIRQHLDELRRATWIDPVRQWWPDYLFHCTDLSNVNILRQGELVELKWSGPGSFGHCLPSSDCSDLV